MRTTRPKSATLERVRLCVCLNWKLLRRLDRECARIERARSALLADLVDRWFAELDAERLEQKKNQSAK